MVATFVTFSQSNDTISLSKAQLESLLDKAEPVKDTSLTPLLVYKDVKAGLVGLAGALKAPVEHVYGVLIKQQVVHSISYLIAVIAASILSWLLLHNGMKFMKSDDYELGGIGMTVVGCIAIAVTACAFFAEIGSIVTGFVNPEYGAIKDIFEFIHGKKE